MMNCCTGTLPSQTRRSHIGIRAKRMQSIFVILNAWTGENKTKAFAVVEYILLPLLQMKMETFENALVWSGITQGNLVPRAFDRLGKALKAEKISKSYILVKIKVVKTISPFTFA